MEFPTRNWTWVSRIVGRRFTVWPTREKKTPQSKKQVSRKKKELLMIWVKILNKEDGARGFPGGSYGKMSACNGGRLWFDPWVRKSPWRRKWQPTPVLLPEKSQPGRLHCPWGHKESDMIERLLFHVHN